MLFIFLTIYTKEALKIRHIILCYKIFICKTYEYGGETYTNYEAGQKQRAYERAIRAEKRYLAGLNSAYNEAKDDTLRQSLKYEMENSAVNLKRKEAELKHFARLQIGASIRLELRSMPLRMCPVRL